MVYEELRELWNKGDFAAIARKLPAPFLIPLEPWVRAALSRQTQPGPLFGANSAPPGPDITATIRSPPGNLTLVHSQLGDRFPALGVAIPLVQKTERNVYPHIAVGRSDNNDVVVDQPSVSRFHADLRVSDKGFVVRDAKSRNGSRRNTELVGDTQGLELSSGDVVAFGDACFLFCLSSDPAVAHALGRLTAK
jgi:hypothetical protein